MSAHQTHICNVSCCRTARVDEVVNVISGVPLLIVVCQDPEGGLLVLAQFARLCVSHLAAHPRVRMIRVECSPHTFQRQRVKRAIGLHAPIPPDAR